MGKELQLSLQKHAQTDRKGAGIAAKFRELYRESLETEADRNRLGRIVAEFERLATAASQKDAKAPRDLDDALAGANATADALKLKVRQLEGARQSGAERARRQTGDAQGYSCAALGDLKAEHGALLTQCRAQTARRGNNKTRARHTQGARAQGAPHSQAAHLDKLCTELKDANANGQ